LALVVLWNTSFETIDETDKENVQIDFFKDFLETVGLLKLPLVLFFSLGILLYVYAEQAVNSWLPAFNNKVLLLPDSVSVQLGMIYGGTLAVGRILGGWLIKRFDWFIVLQISLVSALLLLLSVLSLVQDSTTASVQSKLGLPVVAWLLPMIGFFFAPMYPTLSSTILTSVPSHRQSGMTGLIVLFSAFGGSTGSIMTGTLFGWVGGLSALYFLSVPILLLIILLFPYRKQIRNISNRESKPSPRILS
jgi:fucose permease